jgi:hypothetical protein
VNPPLVQQVRARAQNRCECAGFHFRTTGFRSISITSSRGSTAEAQKPITWLSVAFTATATRVLISHDTKTGDVVRLFHPRKDVWSEHFQLDGAVVAGMTAIGRATVHLLAMNEPEFLAARQALIRERAWLPLA